MAEYIAKESVMEFPIRKNCCYKVRANEYFIEGIETVMEYVENLPAVDVVPVVRCGDCRKFKTYDCRMVVSGYEDFCSCGERRETNGE